MTKLTKCNGDPIIETKQYSLATQEYAATGHDGFTAFIDPECKAVYHHEDL